MISPFTQEDWDEQPPRSFKESRVDLRDSFTGNQASRESTWRGQKQDGHSDRGHARREFREGSHGRFSDRAGPGDRRNAQAGAYLEETTFPVAKSFIGRLIGRGGSRRKQLEEESGTSIHINDGDGDEGIVRIKGHAEGREKAKKLIEDIISCDNRESNTHHQRSGFRDQRSGFRNQNEDSGRQSNEFREQSDGFKRDGFVEQSEGFGGQRAATSIASGFGPESGRSQRESGGGFSQSLSTPAAGEAPACVRKGFKIDWRGLSGGCTTQNDKWANCPPITKAFYVEDPVVAMMSHEEAELIRKENNNIVCVDLSELNRSIPNPCVRFEQAFQHYPLILCEIYKQKFERPSPIQCQFWPIALQGLDVIGIAQTGTGKTLAFLLPAFIHIDGQSLPVESRSGANVLILSPTRELALQIHEEVKKYNYKGIKSCCVYGGGSRKEQITSVENGVQIIIATPGRLNDLIQAGVIDVLSITFLVLDEADRMLDLGFEPQIMKILLDIRPDRQTIMTSATWPSGVRRLATKYMKNPVQVFVGSLDLAAVHSVEQRIEIVEEEDKRSRLMQFLLDEKDPEDKCLVFVGRKTTADDISSDFALAGIECQCIHGDREQCDREQALEDFKTGVVKILVATDVASRGLDIVDISYVFNMDMPRCMEEYVHRIGRTGRAGRTGIAITLVSRKDWGTAAQLMEILAEANQEVPEELVRMSERFARMKAMEDAEGFGGRGRGGRGFGAERRGGGGRGQRRDRAINIMYNGIA